MYMYSMCGGGVGVGGYPNSYSLTRVSYLTIVVLCFHFLTDLYRTAVDLVSFNHCINQSKLYSDKTGPFICYCDCSIISIVL